MIFRRQRLKRKLEVSNAMRRFVQTSFIAVALVIGLMVQKNQNRLTAVVNSTTVVASEVKEEVNKQEETTDVQVEDSGLDKTVVMGSDILIDLDLSNIKPTNKPYTNQNTTFMTLTPMLVSKETVEVNITEPTSNDITSNSMSGNNEIEVKILHANPIIPELIIDFNDITAVSNATKGQIELAVKDTWLEEYGWLYYELEHQYGINAFIAMATAIQETGWEGNSNLALNKNNIYGIMNGDFETKEECIRYYFHLMSNSYVPKGYITLDKINTRYCPPDITWSKDIYKIAMKLNNKVMSTFT